MYNYVHLKIIDLIHFLGSTLADKMPAAFDACFGQVSAGRARGGKRGKRGNRGKKCPSFEKIIGWVEEEFMEDGCVLAELGWIDEEGNDVQDVIEADIATLAPGVQEGLSELAMADCVSDTLAEMDEKYAKCADKYTQEEHNTLFEVGVKIAEYKCFMEMFQDACGNFIQFEYVEPLVQSLYAAPTIMG